MTGPDTARAFAAAEAAYLDPPLLDAEAVNAECECACDMCENDLHCCQVDCHVNDENYEPDYEREAEEREEMREERWSRD